MKRVVRVALVAFAALWAVAFISSIAMRRRAVPLPEPDADEIELVAVFAPLAYRSTARRFRGGSIDCRFGGGTVDLRAATLDPAGAHLTVRAVFGGGQLAVPASWRVVVNSRGLGGVSAPPAPPGDGPVLTIDATTMFGGFGVTTDVDEGSERWLSEMLASQAGRTGMSPVD